MDGTGGTQQTATRLTAFADVEEAFKSRDFKPGWGEGKSDPLTLHSLVSIAGQDHFERRRILSALFRRTALLRYDREILAPASRRLLADLAPRQAPNGALGGDLLVLARAAFLHVGCELVGIDAVERPGTIARLSALTKTLSAGNNVAEATRDPDEVMREALEAKRCFEAEFFRPSWERRRSLREGDGTRQLDDDRGATDLLTLMLRHAEHYGRWEPEVLLRDAILFITAVAGSPTRAIPHVVAELDSWLREHPEDVSQLADPVFLRDAFFEAHRLHPRGLPKPHRCVRDTVLPSGRRVRAGELLLLDIKAAGRDTTVFGLDADRFRLPREIPGGKPHHLVFGGGPHTCIGAALTVGEPSSDPEAPLGMAIRFLLEGYRAGMRPDPEQPPTWDTATLQDNYASFPVRFD